MRPRKPIYTIEIYEDHAKEWRWHIRHRNGNLVAESGEGYCRRADAVRTLRRLLTAPGEAFGAWI